MAPIYHVCHNATTFTASGEVDPEAYALSVQRLVDSGHGVYAAGGSGECYSLTRDEIGLLYDVAVDVCKGKVLVGSNQLEQHTARASLELAQFAASHRVDICSIYGPAGWHGYRATAAEYIHYFDQILREFMHPVALCPNPVIGYRPEPQTIAAIADKYRQVQSINLTGINDDDLYFIRLRDALHVDVDVHVSVVGSLNTLSLGAAGLTGAESNLLPKTVRRYMDLYEAGAFAEQARVYADLRRFMDLVKRWRATARWIKMAFTLFGLPGGAGGTREPYVAPTQAERDEFRASLLALDIPEINELATAAGVGQ